MNRTELYDKLRVKLMERGYIFYKIGGIEHFEMPRRGSGYLEIHLEKIILRADGIGTLLQSKRYKDFEELFEILSELNAERESKHIFKEYCNVLRNLCYISETFEEGIMQDLENLCEKYTNFLKNEKSE